MGMEKCYIGKDISESFYLIQLIEGDYWTRGQSGEMFKGLVIIMEEVVMLGMSLSWVKWGVSFDACRRTKEL